MKKLIIVFILGILLSSCCFTCPAYYKNFDRINRVSAGKVTYLVPIYQKNSSSEYDGDQIKVITDKHWTFPIPAYIDISVGDEIIIYEMYAKWQCAYINNVDMPTADTCWELLPWLP